MHRRSFALGAAGTLFMIAALVALVPLGGVRGGGGCRTPVKDLGLRDTSEQLRGLARLAARPSQRQAEPPSAEALARVARLQASARRYQACGRPAKVRLGVAVLLSVMAAAFALVATTGTAEEDFVDRSAPARDRSRSPPRIDRVLALVVVAAGVLRFWKLGAQSLWFDEFVTSNVVSKGKLFSNVAAREGTPPLYFTLLWGWTRVFGDADATLRSLSAVAGTATVPVAYAAARELTRSRRVARVAAVLIAVNPMFVWFSQEARAYALFAFVGTLSLLFCVQARMRGRTRDLLLWGVASAAALSTHYFAVFLVLPETAWLIVCLRRRWRQLLVGYVPLILAGPLLFLFFSAQHARNNQGWIADFPLGFRVAEAGRQALIGPGGWDDHLWVCAAVPLLLAAAIVVVRGNHRERSAAAVMVALGVTGLVLPLAGATIGSDFFLPRNVIASFIPLAIAVAIALGARRAGWMGAFATVGLCVLSIAIVVAVATDADFQKANWRRIAKVIDTTDSASVVVIDHDGHLAEPMLRYFRAARILRPDETVRVQEVDLLFSSQKPVDRCAKFQGRVCEISLFPPFPAPLADRFTYVETLRFAGFAVKRYRADQPAPVKMAPFVRTPPQPAPVVLLRREQPVMGG